LRVAARQAQATAAVMAKASSVAQHDAGVAQALALATQMQQQWRDDTARVQAQQLGSAPAWLLGLGATRRAATSQRLVHAVDACQQAMAQAAAGRSALTAAQTHFAAADRALTAVADHRERWREAQAQWRARRREEG